MKIKTTSFVSIILGALLLGSIIGCGTSGGGGNATSRWGTAAGESTARTQGWGGEIAVTVKMVDGKITEVTARGESETPSIAGPALSQIPNRIIRDNTYDVDAISGATITSDAIIIAAKAAIEQIVKHGGGNVNVYNPAVEEEHEFHEDDLFG